MRVQTELWLFAASFVTMAFALAVHSAALWMMGSGCCGAALAVGAREGGAKSIYLVVFLVIHALNLVQCALLGGPWALMVGNLGLFVVGALAGWYAVAGVQAHGAEQTSSGP